MGDWAEGRGTLKREVGSAIIVMVMLQQPVNHQPFERVSCQLAIMAVHQAPRFLKHSGLETRALTLRPQDASYNPLERFGKRLLRRP